MTAVYLGGGSVGTLVPGVNEALEAAGNALQNLRGAVDTAIGAIGAASAELDGLASDINAARDGIVATGLDPINANLAAAQGALSDLQAITDPGAYLSSVLTAIDGARALIAGLTPENYLADAIAGASSAVSSIGSAVNGLASDISDLTDASQLTGVITDAIDDIQGALTNASNAAIGGLTAFAAAVSALANTGAHAAYYTGALSGMGAGIDSVTPTSGLTSSLDVVGCTLFAATGAGAESAIKWLFGVP